VTHLHHAAIVVRDVERSLRFWRDGLGLDVLADQEFDGDWPALFGVDSMSLRSIFLGDPQRADAGIVELVVFPADDPQHRPPEAGSGFFLLSFFVDVDDVLDRLDALGLGGALTRIAVPLPNGAQVPMATVRDPDGVLVELIGAPA
jgi:catechol 2,3-dioxygenase-like lactoylglutathione lyase family enzyme